MPSELEDGEVSAAQQAATSWQPVPGSASAETSSQAGRSVDGALCEAQRLAVASCQATGTLQSGSWWETGLCTELDSDGEGAAVEQQEACPQTVLVQDHQVGARQNAFAELACLQMSAGELPCCS